MAFTRKAYEDGDFVRIRDFLKYSLFKDPSLKNWLIDRWNFGRYFSQTMHGTFDTWPETVGIWEDENGEIVVVVNSEGEVINTKAGNAFLQLGNSNFSDGFLSELIDYAERNLALTTDEGTIEPLSLETSSIIANMMIGEVILL